jgi:hypothetical protein
MAIAFLREKKSGPHRRINSLRERQSAARRRTLLFARAAATTEL